MESIETGSTAMSSEAAVRDRYSAAALEREVALCCPVDYAPEYLKAIPQEVLDRDYGCGDPSRYVRPGDTVLDLGSGSGKIAFIAAQVAGPKGAVIGVDMNEDMLKLARGAAPHVASALGFANVEFRRGRIQDLALDLDRLESWLVEHPVRSVADLTALEEERARIRRENSLISDASVDLVVSNCVLNLVRKEDRRRLLAEIFRVVKIGGRIAISDIVSDEEVPEELQRDPELFSGCVSGAFQECGILTAIEDAGFYGIAIDRWEVEPFAVIGGIEFRSVTITACKGKPGARLDAKEAVIYRGPWKRVEDDDGNVLVRGERSAVCAKSFEILCSEPYEVQVIPVPPRVLVGESDRGAFDCSRSRLRDPRETKGEDYVETRRPGEGGCC